MVLVSIQSNSILLSMILRRKDLFYIVYISRVQSLTPSLQVMDPPSLLSPFRQSHGVISRDEGPNDGLVSVASAQWGSYKGTLVGVNHLDLINWTNRWKWMLRSLVGITPGYVEHYSLLYTVAYKYVASMLSPFTLISPTCSRRRASSGCD